MELYQLKYFLEAARQSNFSRAAASLNLAQAALSEQMRKLEQELGTPLFHRGGRATTLTAAGQTLRRHAEDLVDRARAARQAVQDLVGLHQGRLVLGAIPSVSACLLPAVIASFRRRHPRIELSLQEGTSEEVAQWVDRGRVELGVVQHPLQSAHLTAASLFTEPFVLLLPRQHGLAKQRRVALSRLAQEPFVLYKGRARSTALEACRQAGFEPRIVCESSELDTVRSLVAAGLGLAILPQLAARQKLAGCKTLPLSGEPVQREVLLIRRAGHADSPSAHVFAGLLAKACASRLSQ
jgi:DNA-binding transcriptional LysR family regulator